VNANVVPDCSRLEILRQLAHRCISGCVFPRERERERERLPISASAQRYAESYRYLESIIRHVGQVESYAFNYHCGISFVNEGPEN